MIAFLRHLIGWIIIIFRSRQDLVLENLALRAIAGVAHQTPPSSTPDHSQAVLDWPPKALVAWNESLILVTPRTGLQQIGRVEIQKKVRARTEIDGSMACSHSFDEEQVKTT